MRTVRRLRLRFLCLRPGTPNPTASTLPSAITPTLCPVETMQAHQKKKCNMMTNINSVITTTSHVLHLSITYPLLVDLGGFAPPSRTLFLITVYAVLCSIYLF